MKDPDLDVLLVEYRNKKPNELQLQKWKDAVKNQLPSRIRPRMIAQLIAASAVGFIVGALFFGQSKKSDVFADSNATIEYVVTDTN